MYLKRATSEEFECSHHTEMRETEGEEYVDRPDLIITQCMREPKHHNMSIKKLSKIKGYKLAWDHNYTAL